MEHSRLREMCSPELNARGVLRVPQEAMGTEHQWPSVGSQLLKRDLCPRNASIHHIYPYLALVLWIRSSQIPIHRFCHSTRLRTCHRTSWPLPPMLLTGNSILNLLSATSYLLPPTPYYNLFPTFRHYCFLCIPVLACFFSDCRPLLLEQFPWFKMDLTTVRPLTFPSSGMFDFSFWRLGHDHRPFLDPHVPD